MSPKVQNATHDSVCDQLFVTRFARRPNTPAMVRPNPSAIQRKASPVLNSLDFMVSLLFAILEFDTTDRAILHGIGGLCDFILTVSYVFFFLGWNHDHSYYV